MRMRWYPQVKVYQLQTWRTKVPKKYLSTVRKQFARFTSISSGINYGKWSNAAIPIEKLLKIVKKAVLGQNPSGPTLDKMELLPRKHLKS